MSTVSEHLAKTVAHEESTIDVETLIANFGADAAELARTSLDSPEFGVLVMVGREGSSEYCSELFDRKKAAGVTTAAWLKTAIETFISNCVSLPSVVAVASPAWTRRVATFQNTPIGDEDALAAPAADGALLRIFDLNRAGGRRDFIAFRADSDSDGIQLTPWCDFIRLRTSGDNDDVQLTRWYGEADNGQEGTCGYQPRKARLSKSGSSLDRVIFPAESDPHVGESLSVLPDNKKQEDTMERLLTTKNDTDDVATAIVRAVGEYIADNIQLFNELQEEADGDLLFVIDAKNQARAQAVSLDEEPFTHSLRSLGDSIVKRFTRRTRSDA